MNKEFIPYEIAIELKQLGFDEPCFKYIYTGDTGNNVNTPCEVLPSKAKNYNEDDLCVSTPTYSQAFRWFREKHLLEGLVLPQNRSVPDPLPIYFIAVISYEDGGMNELFNSTAPISMLHYSEYEEAELGCLRHLILAAKENEKQI